MTLPLPVEEGIESDQDDPVAYHVKEGITSDMTRTGMPFDRGKIAQDMLGICSAIVISFWQKSELILLDQIIES
jgi:hypothetical protein